LSPVQIDVVSNIKSASEFEKDTQKIFRVSERFYGSSNEPKEGSKPPKIKIETFPILVDSYVKSAAEFEEKFSKPSKRSYDHRKNPMGLQTA